MSGAHMSMSMFYGRLRPQEVVECWKAVNGAPGCCPGCRTGTADCDVNPLAPPLTRERAAFLLMRAGECP